MIKINVISVELGEMRQFEHENFDKSIRKVKLLVEKMSMFENNFLYEIVFEECPYENIKTFKDFDSFKTALKGMTIIA